MNVKVENSVASQENPSSFSSQKGSPSKKNSTPNKNNTSQEKPKDNRGVINDLIKENEHLKTLLNRKSEEVKRLEERLNRHQMMITRLKKKVAELKNKRDRNHEKNEEKEETKATGAGYSKIFSDNELPKTSQFMMENYSVEDNNLLMAIQDYGPTALIHLLFGNTENKRRKMHIVSFISHSLNFFKEFIDKLVGFQHELVQVTSSKDLNELTQRLASETDFYFNAKTIRLWRIDKIKGALLAEDPNGNSIEASISRGIIADCIKEQSPIECNC